MPNLEIKTNVLAPEEDITREFEGDNPAKLFGLMNELIRSTFRVGAASFFEDKVKWDKLGDPVEFFGQWRGKDSKDQWTTFWIKVVIIGKQNQKDKKGKVKVKIKPWLYTKMPYSTGLDKAMKTINMRSFYSNQIKAYVAAAKREIEKFDNEIRALFEAHPLEEV